MNLETIDSSRGIVLTQVQGVSCLNLNSLVRSVNDIRIQEVLIKNIKNYQSLNINNLCSLCIKLNLDYYTDGYILLQHIIQLIKQINPFICLHYDGVENFFEIDCNMYNKLFHITDNKIQIVKCLRDVFLLLGFTNKQIISSILTYKQDIVSYLPQDLINKFYIKQNNEIFLNKLRSLL